jgi:hypothetical protein
MKPLRSSRSASGFPATPAAEDSGRHLRDRITKVFGAGLPLFIVLGVHDALPGFPSPLRATLRILLRQLGMSRSPPRTNIRVHPGSEYGIALDHAVGRRLGSKDIVDNSYEFRRGTAEAADRAEPGMGAELEAIHLAIIHFLTHHRDAIKLTKQRVGSAVSARIECGV